MDWVLYRMLKAAEHEYAHHMKQEFGVSMGVHQTEEIDVEEEEEEEGTKKDFLRIKEHDYIAQESRERGCKEEQGERKKKEMGDNHLRLWDTVR